MSGSFLRTQIRLNSAHGTVIVKDDLRAVLRYVLQGRPYRERQVEQRQDKAAFIELPCVAPESSRKQSPSVRGPAMNRKAKVGVPLVEEEPA